MMLVNDKERQTFVEYRFSLLNLLLFGQYFSQGVTTLAEQRCNRSHFMFVFFDRSIFLVYLKAKRADSMGLLFKSDFQKLYMFILSALDP
jgi:hypothetical protein